MAQNAAKAEGGGDMPLFQRPAYDEQETHDIKARVARNAFTKTLKDETPLHLKAEMYIKDNPEIYRLFCKFAWEALNAGCETISASLITERIRWETKVYGTGDFKVSNNYRAYMARKFMDEFPQVGEVFRTRATKHEKGEE